MLPPSPLCFWPCSCMCYVWYQVLVNVPVTLSPFSRWCLRLVRIISVLVWWDTGSYSVLSRTDALSYHWNSSRPPTAVSSGGLLRDDFSLLTPQPAVCAAQATGLPSNTIVFLAYIVRLISFSPFIYFYFFLDSMGFFFPASRRRFTPATPPSRVRCFL